MGGRRKGKERAGSAFEEEEEMKRTGAEVGEREEQAHHATKEEWESCWKPERRGRCPRSLLDRASTSLESGLDQGILQDRLRE